MTSLVLVSQRAVPLANGPAGRVHRVRTVLLDPVSGASAVDEHVRVRYPAPRGRPDLADVLTAPGTGAPQAARLAARHPGALVVAVCHGPRCWIRPGPAGPPLTFTAHATGAPAGVWDALASLVHSCLVAGVSAPDLGATAVRLLRAQPCGSPFSRRCRRWRSASASSERSRPTEV